MGEKRVKILTAIVFVATVILALLLSIKNRNYENLPAIDSPKVSFTGGLDNLNPLERKIINELRTLTIPDSAIKSTFMIETETKEINVLIPKGKPMEEIIQAIQHVSKKTAYSLEDSYYSGKSDRARLLFTSSRKNQEDIVLNLKRARHGYFRRNASMILIVSGLDTTSADIRLRYLTFEGEISYQIPSWTPQLDSIAVVLEHYQAPLIVELPLESKSRTKSTLYTLRIDDSKSSIDAKLSELMRHAPSTSAISAASGDLFLETRNVTSTFFDELKKRRLIFFDKRKGSNKRAGDIANNKKVSYIRSNKKLKGTTAEELGMELRRLCHTAGGRKQIIVWGEASEALIDALETSGDYFDKTGVTLQGINVLYN